MPNHCSNRLVVSGPSLETFKSYAKGSGPKWDGVKDHECVYSETKVCLVCTVKPDECELLDLNKFVPVPGEYLLGKGGKDAYNSGGYDWVVSNWGTKWGCYDTDLIQTPGKLTYYFQTAWGPFNNSVHRAMSSAFPNLRLELKYAERGSVFFGTRVCKNGKVIKDVATKGRPTSEVMRQLWKTSG